MRLEEPARLLEGALDRSGDVLEYVARQYEIVSAISIRVRLSDVQPRLAIVERIGVVELFRERNGVARLVAETQARANQRATRRAACTLPCTEEGSSPPCGPPVGRTPGRH